MCFCVVGAIAHLFLEWLVRSCGETRAIVKKLTKKLGVHVEPIVGFESEYGRLGLGASFCMSSGRHDGKAGRRMASSTLWSMKWCSSPYLRSTVGTPNQCRINRISASKLAATNSPHLQQMRR